jgi:cytochrome c oxidase subunit I+III
MLSRRWNRLDLGLLFHAALAAALFLALAGAAALLAGPWTAGLAPQRHSYDATVWALVVWTVAHVLVGVIMQAYCVARRLARRMTAEHDIDIVNVTLYWHFVAITVLVTTAVIGGFPLVS